MMGLREQFVYLSAAVILMSYVSISAYYERFDIIELVDNLPPVALLLQGIVTTIGSFKALGLLALILGALTLGNLKMAVQLGRLRAPFSLIPWIVSPFAVWLLVLVGQQIGQTRYAVDTGPDSHLPALIRIDFSDDTQCNQSGVCLRRSLPAECNDKAPGPACRVVLLSDQAIYLVDLSAQHATPYAHRVSMNEVQHVTVDTNE